MQLVRLDPAEEWGMLPGVIRYAGGLSVFASHGHGLGERIYTLSAGGGAPSEVTGTQFGFAPVFSPDGRTIAFARRFFWERADGTAYLSV